MRGVDIAGFHKRTHERVVRRLRRNVACKPHCVHHTPRSLHSRWAASQQRAHHEVVRERVRIQVLLCADIVQHHPQSVVLVLVWVCHGMQCRME